MTTSLVTGGAGFIGAHVTNDLISMGHQVVVLDDLSGGFQDNVNPEATFIRGSITDVELIERLFLEHDFDYVYHLAAYAAEGLSLPCSVDLTPQQQNRVLAVIKRCAQHFGRQSDDLPADAA